MNDPRLEPYTTRSLRELQSRLDACNDPSERMILLAKKAANLARLTRTAQASQIVKDLRSLNQNYEPRLSAWIMYCDGLILLFESLQDLQAFDRFRRAYLFSCAVMDRELSGSCAAWIAKCEFTAGRFASVFEHLIASFRWAEPSHGDARARASMVLADTLNLSGQIELARSWYKRGRNYAILEGDISMQNVMMFNLAAFSVTHLVLRDCCGEVSEDECWRASMEVNSATNLDQTLGSRKLQSMAPLLRADLLTIQGRWQEALLLYLQFIDESLAEGQARHQPQYLAHCAWCCTGLSEFEKARSFVSDSISKLSQCTDFDDLAITHFRISKSAKAFGDAQLSSHHETLAIKHLELFREQQRELRDGLKQTLDTIERIELERKNPA